MYFPFFLGAVLYGAVTLLVLILSSAELLKSGLSTSGRHLGILVTSVFWPVTLLAVALQLLLQALSNRLASSAQASALGSSR